MGFLFYYLLSNPETLRKAYQEVDEVIGDNAVELSHLPKLKYLQAAIRETLRMRPPIPTISRQHVAPGDFMLGGKYKVQAGTPIIIALRALHVDEAVWGDDGDKFRPERFLNGGWENLPPHAWKPFGQGARSCIGRGLAEQEMLIATALILARFVVEKDDPSYQLRQSRQSTCLTLHTN
jgi:cytochrome P450/NADPH-cytochrome P450 reductase